MICINISRLFIDHLFILKINCQILSAIPRALASEQQTSKLMLLKTKLHEITSSTDDAIVTFDMVCSSIIIHSLLKLLQAHADFKKKSTAPNFAALEVIII